MEHMWGHGPWIKIIQQQKCSDNEWDEPAEDISFSLLKILDRRVVHRLCYSSSHRDILHISVLPEKL